MEDWFATGSVLVLVTRGIRISGVTAAFGGRAAGEQERAGERGDEREEREVDT
jgi:hypothetical protein